MLYKSGPFGYFARVQQHSRGPWFAEMFVEDDGLEWYYVFKDNAGNTNYLLSSNMTYNDRTEYARMFWAQRRANLLATFAGLGIGIETINRVPYFKRMAIGWKMISLGAVAWAAKSCFNMWNAKTYGPVIGAYHRKYDSVCAPDLFEITDRKREYYEIDDSQYMSYTEEDLTDHRHVSYGP